MNKLTQLIIFAMSYVGWFACILAGKYGIGLWVFLVPFIFAVTLARFTKITFRHACGFAIIAAIGIAFDSLALRLGWVALVTPTGELLPVGELTPAWLVALWILFGCTIPLYDGWMNGRFWLAAILGFIIGPLSYRSGAAFDTLLFPDKTVFIYYGLFWACFFPLCLFIYERSRNEVRIKSL